MTRRARIRSRTRSSVVGVSALALFVLGAGGVPRTGRQDDLADVLARARAAAGTGSWKEGTSLRLRGGATFLGVEESLSICFAADGRFRMAFDGDLYREVRFDGRKARLAEFAPPWHELEFFDREAELLRTWVHSGFWLSREAPVEIRAEPNQDDEGLVALALRIEGGALEARLLLDREEYLARALEFQTGNGKLTARYDEYAAASGLRVARKVKAELSIGSEFVLRVAQIDPQRVDGELFEPEPDEPDFRFDENVAPDVEVVRSRSKHQPSDE